MLWLVVSLAFKVYVTNFTDYNASYGAVGGVIVLMLWFYVSGIAILAGAELNAEIEHASPYGKAPGEKSPAGRRLLGRRAARAFEQRQTVSPAAEDHVERIPPPDTTTRRPAVGAAFAVGVLLARWLARRTPSVGAARPSAPGPSIGLPRTR